MAIRQHQQALKTRRNMAVFVFPEARRARTIDRARADAQAPRPDPPIPHASYSSSLPARGGTRSSGHPRVRP